MDKQDYKHPNSGATCCAYGEAQLNCARYQSYDETVDKSNPYLSDWEKNHYKEVAKERGIFCRWKGKGDECYE